MTVVRIVKDKNFITMGKYHLQEKEMSLKAIGLLSLMLSLPDNWDYSVKGLTAIRKESYDTIRAILLELEKYGYLHRTQIKSETGKFVDVEYTIYEKPLTEKPITENPLTENYSQLNNKLINKEIINKLTNKKEIYKERFKKPTLEEVEQYCKERNNTVDAKRFFDYYEVANWKDVKNWKQKLITWEMHQPTKKKTREEEIEEMNKRLAYLDEE